MSHRQMLNSARFDAFVPRVGLTAVLVAATLTSCGGGSSGTAPQSAAALPDGNHIVFANTSVLVTELDGRGSVSVVRTGDASGETSVSFRVNDGSAVNGTDFDAVEGMVSWVAGETGPKQINFDLLPDVSTESLENFDIELFGLNGDETLYGSRSVTVEIADVACSLVAGAMGRDTTLNQPCYHVTDSIMVTGSAQLTIAAGTTLLANPDAGISITDNASIAVSGSQGQPAYLKGSERKSNSWKGVSITSTNPMQQINHAVIEGARFGVDLLPGAQLGSFSDNTIKNTSSAAIRLHTDALDSLGSGLTFENNPGGIQIIADRVTAAKPLTLKPQATHYSTGTTLIVDGDLVLQPGVDLRFANDTQIYISQNGSLNAVGTAAKPIALTGINPAPGYWAGIQWVSSTSSNNHLSYVTVSHGGGDAARSGNLILDGNNVNLVIENSTISGSAGYGLYLLDNNAMITQNNVTYTNNDKGESFSP